MVLVWLGLVAAGEVLAHPARPRRATSTSPVVGVTAPPGRRRLRCGRLPGGAEPAGSRPRARARRRVWAAGALLLAYAVRGVAPLLLGVALLAFWFVWEVVTRGDGRLRGLDRAGRCGARRRVGGVAATWCSAGAASPPRGARRAPSWRCSALFVAALPYAWGDAEGSVAAAGRSGRRGRARRARRSARRPRDRLEVGLVASAWPSRSACRSGASTRTCSTRATCRPLLGCGRCSRSSPTSPSRAGTRSSAGCGTPAAHLARRGGADHVHHRAGVHRLRPGRSPAPRCSSSSVSRCSSPASSPTAAGDGSSARRRRPCRERRSPPRLCRGSARCCWPGWCSSAWRSGHRCRRGSPARP